MKEQEIQEELERKAEEERRQKEELERFEKMMEGKKKKRNRKRFSEVQELTFWQKNRTVIGVVSVVLVAIGTVAFMKY